MVCLLTDRCTVCDKITTQRCDRCTSARYCSSECQKSDWPTHKLLCTTFANFDSSTRPSNEHYKAILFPVDSTKPEIVWIDAPSLGNGFPEYGAPQSPQVGPFLGPDLTPCVTMIQYSKLLERTLQDTVMVGYGDSFLIDGLERNKSIAKVCKTQPTLQCYDWRGPVVVYTMHGVGLDPCWCKDTGITDYRHATDFFLSYNTVCLRTPPVSPFDDVIGILMYCAGDQKTLRKPEFEQVRVTIEDSIFSDPETSDVAERVGLPIFTRRHPAKPSSAEQHTDNANQLGGLLHLCLDPKAECDLSRGVLGFGWVPWRWQNEVGSVLVVRQDRKPLSTLDVEALGKYCFEDVIPLFAHWKGEYSEVAPMTSDEILDKICRSTFESKWRRLQEMKRSGGDIAEYRFPYDL